MNSCKTCEKAIFDEIWGDYKCKVDEIIHDPDKKMDCENYKPGSPTMSKKAEQPKSR